jgi:hypothetical protein
MPCQVLILASPRAIHDYYDRAAMVVEAGLARLLMANDDRWKHLSLPRITEDRRRHGRACRKAPYSLPTYQTGSVLCHV